jgi:hypothetical protein
LGERAGRHMFLTALLHVLPGWLQYLFVLLQGQFSPAVAGLALSNLFMTCTMVPFIMKLKAEYRYPRTESQFL